MVTDASPKIPSGPSHIRSQYQNVEILVECNTNVTTKICTLDTYCFTPPSNLTKSCVFISWSTLSFLQSYKNMSYEVTKATSIKCHSVSPDETEHCFPLCKMRLAKNAVTPKRSASKHGSSPVIRVQLMRQ